MLAGGGDSSLDTLRLCQVAAKATAMTGAGVMLMSGGLPRGSLCATDEISGLIEQLQYTLGEGPCIDAYEQDRGVFEPDLALPAASRWPAFTGPALDGGVRAIFGFPVRIGAVRLGALDLYRDRPGPLTEDQHADALVTADLVAEAIVAIQADAAPEQIAQAFTVDSDFHYGVHQASGMISAQLKVSVEEAMVRLRAHAFATGQTINSAAQLVVERKLQFDRPAEGGDDDS